jgi:hypothetical protein
MISTFAANISAGTPLGHARNLRERRAHSAIELRRAEGKPDQQLCSFGRVARPTDRRRSNLHRAEFGNEYRGRDLFRHPCAPRRYGETRRIAQYERARGLTCPSWDDGGGWQGERRDERLHDMSPFGALMQPLSCCAKNKLTAAGTTKLEFRRLNSLLGPGQCPPGCSATGCQDPCPLGQERMPARMGSR